MKLIRRGKVKDVYQMEDGNLLFHFSDRVSAFDVKISTPIPRKGEILCKFAEFWFSVLKTPNHFLKSVDKDKMLVRPLQMIPVECVTRGYFYGSLAERYDAGKPVPFAPSTRPALASRLDKPIFDPTTKSEEHDLPVTRDEALKVAGISPEQYNYLAETSTSLYERMNSTVGRAGFILADVKFEFGLDIDGTIILADSLGPDEFRLWRVSEYSPGRIQESYDKQLLRDWLVKSGFKQKVDMLAAKGMKPESPEIPSELAQELSRRYASAYEQITGQHL